MPLSARRRRRPQLSTPISLKTSAPAGTSLLEQLPYEILVQIFIFSQNVELPQTSKTLFARLGYEPSDWLMLEFFAPDGRGLNLNEDY